MTRTVLTLLPVVAAALPPIVVTVLIARYGVNVPYWDQWDFVPVLEAAAEGHLGLAHFWTQANEHRIVLPRVVMFALARITRWDVRYELLTNVVLALAMFSLLGRLLSQTMRTVRPALTPYLVLAASLSTFSIATWDNWLWGMQIDVFMNALAAVAAVWALARYGRSRTGLALALLAGIAGALSYGNGLILVPLVALGYALLPGDDGRPGRLLGTAIAVTAGLVVTALYFVGFQSASPWFPLMHPIVYVHYVLTYLGAGFALYWSPTLAAVAGAVGFLVFVGCVLGIWLCCPSDRTAILPWLLLALYALLSGAMAGVARAGLFGVSQALSPRYRTFSSLFWLSLLGFATVATVRVGERRTMARPWRVAGPACSLLAGLMIVSSFWSDMAP